MPLFLFSYDGRGERVELSVPAEIKAIRALADQPFDGFVQLILLPV